MLVVNSQLVEGTGVSQAPTGKFILNDSAIIFFPTSQKHNSVKLHALSYEDDYRGNALAGIFTENRIEIRFHRDFTDERVRRIWGQVCATPELSFLKGREVYYQGRKI